MKKRATRNLGIVTNAFAISKPRRDVFVEISFKTTVKKSAVGNNRTFLKTAHGISVKYRWNAIT